MAAGGGVVPVLIAGGTCLLCAVYARKKPGAPSSERAGAPDSAGPAPVPVPAEHKPEPEPLATYFENQRKSDGVYSADSLSPSDPHPWTDQGSADRTLGSDELE
eukprot:SAG22_NODE_7247_length_758_cov_0.902883_1_plen_103_part_10